MVITLKIEVPALTLNNSEKPSPAKLKKVTATSVFASYTADSVPSSTDYLPLTKETFIHKYIDVVADVRCT